MHKVYTRAAAMFLAISGAAAAAQGQVIPSSGFFDWPSAPRGGVTTPNYTQPPILTNGNAAAVRAQLAADRAAGRTLAVTVIEPLTSGNARSIFDDFNIRYVFTDFEDVDRVGRTRAVADLVVNSSQSSNAFIGNFNSYPRAGSDNTRPSNTNPDNVADSFDDRPSDFDYAEQRGRRGETRSRQMANPSLYPGSPDFKNPAQGNSNAPNIRSALFTNPIKRLTLAKNGLPSGDQLIPWVNRFNNFGNPALDSDGNGSNGYQFVQNASNPENGQLLSRGDFSAMMLHYRMRGAHTFHLFQGSAGNVVGYTDEQQRFDARKGWTASTVGNGIFTRNNFAFANLTTLVGDTNGSSGDTNPRDIEQAGAVWSGVYDRAGSNRRMVILFSNLSPIRKVIDLPNSIGGFMTARQDGVRMDDFFLDPGQHKFVTFTLRGNKWVLNTNVVGFTDDNRNGVGVPEPTGLALVGLGAMGLLARRRRRVTA